MSLKDIRARIVDREEARELRLTVFPAAPLARVQISPSSRDGIVLDIHELRELRDAVDGVITEFEEAP